MYLQADLDSMALHWNSHCIRPTKNQNVPNGRPFTMFYMPHLYNALDYLCDIDKAKMDTCEELCNVNVLLCDETMRELCDMLLLQHHLQKPTSATDLSDLYIFLKTDN